MTSPSRLDESLSYDAPAWQQLVAFKSLFSSTSHPPENSSADDSLELEKLRLENTLIQAEIFKLNAYMAPAIMLMVLSGIIGGFLSDKIKKQKPFVIGSALVLGVCLIVFAFRISLISV